VTRCIVSYAVCLERTPKLLQSVIDAAPPAKKYYSDAFNTYRELCYWGEHQALYNKSQTYSVEGTNADLRHYLARLGRKSRCFSRCLEALTRAVDLFVHAYNQRQLKKREHPKYSYSLTDFVSCRI
jgi:insertion element IS1 protein InsB